MAIDWRTVIFNMLTIKGIYGREMYETWYKMSVLLNPASTSPPSSRTASATRTTKKGFEAMIGGQTGKVILDWTRYVRESTRPSAWLALLLTSLSGIAALYAVVNLGELIKRSITDVNLEAIGLILAFSGFIAALVWFVRSRNLCAVGTLITASWLSFIWYLQFP
jgi:hypothetical protein